MKIIGRLLDWFSSNDPDAVQHQESQDQTKEILEVLKSIDAHLEKIASTVRRPYRGGQGPHIRAYGDPW